MKLNKAKKAKTMRGKGMGTHGWGARKKHMVSGHRGGFGMAGTGKRGDHKKVPVKKGDKKNRYFGKQGITSKGTERKRVNTMNLSMIKENLFTKDNVKIELKKYKILGVGEGFKAEITAMSASKTAIAKMEKAGGKIILAGEKKSVKQYVVKEKKAEEAKE